jgi:enoyl-CoA hydratase
MHLMDILAFRDSDNATERSPQRAADDTQKDELLYTRQDGIGKVTFNRPEARNALTSGMYERLAEIAADPGDVRALIITGAGGNAFAAGTDISEFRGFDTAADAMTHEARIDRVLGTLERSKVPTIAAIAGACTGGGAAIAAACDLRIASANARFGFPIARTLGNCLSMSSIARLSALVGPARVIEMIFTARTLSASDALACGLVTKVLPGQVALEAEAVDLATLVGSHAPLTMRATREALCRLRDNLPPDEDLIRMCYDSRDFAEGMDAFLTRRHPIWRGE